MTDKRRIEILEDVLGCAIHKDASFSNIKCWQDASDYLIAVGFHKFKWSWNNSDFIRNVIKTLKEEGKNYTLIDIPVKEGLMVLEKLTNEDSKKFIFQHMKVTEDEYIENQEKLSKYYNILKRNNPELKSSNVKLLNECSEMDWKMHYKGYNV